MGGGNDPFISCGAVINVVCYSKYTDRSFGSIESAPHLSSRLGLRGNRINWFIPTLQMSTINSSIVRGTSQSQMASDVFG